MRILGIDPGSRITGYGIIQIESRKACYVACGAIRAEGKNFPDRLKTIFEGVHNVVSSYQPDEMAIEKVFVKLNIDSALKLGQARGAAICATIGAELSVAEYTPTQIKKAVVGQGHATKAQVQHMVRVLLNLSATPQSDAADALATALCHFNTSQTMAQVGSAKSMVRGRWR